MRPCENVPSSCLYFTFAPPLLLITVPSTSVPSQLPPSFLHSLSLSLSTHSLSELNQPSFYDEVTAMEVPESFGYYANGVAEFSPEKKHGEQFAVDDLLDFSNEDAIISDDFFDNVGASSAESSAVTAVDSRNSSVSGSFGDANFSGELCVPYDDLAELEWLSNFVEDSFSTKHNLQQPVAKNPTPASSGTQDHFDAVKPAATHRPIFLHEAPLPSKSRSKRSRAAPCDWTTRLLHLSPAMKPPKTIKRRENPVAELSENAPRRCFHCASEKTPQWRTGPMGPKTLCNACGVRYKSGRLVPEYRPAASPTFVSAKHSNSHRKVLELRRQMEVFRAQQHHHQFLSQTPIFAKSNGVDEFLMNRYSAPRFSQMI